MSTARHIPGPWKITGGQLWEGEDKNIQWAGWIEPALDDHAVYIGSIAHVQSATHIKGISCEEAEATARLIAAAPDLLDAAKGAERILKDMYLEGFEYSFRFLSEAIAKADGSTPWVPPYAVQTSAQDEATIARIEEQRLTDAADHFPDATKMVTEHPLHVRAMLANAEARMASDRIAKQLDDKQLREHLPLTWLEHVRQDLLDLKAAAIVLETIVQRMAHIHTTEG